MPISIVKDQIAVIAATTIINTAQPSVAADTSKATVSVLASYAGGYSVASCTFTNTSRGTIRFVEEVLPSGEVTIVSMTDSPARAYFNVTNMTSIRVTPETDEEGNIVMTRVTGRNASGELEEETQDPDTVTRIEYYDPQLNMSDDMGDHVVGALRDDGILFSLDSVPYEVFNGYVSFVLKIHLKDDWNARTGVYKIDFTVDCIE